MARAVVEQDSEEGGKEDGKKMRVRKRNNERKEKEMKIRP